MGRIRAMTMLMAPNAAVSIRVVLMDDCFLRSANSSLKVDAAVSSVVSADEIRADKSPSAIIGDSALFSERNRALSPIIMIPIKDSRKPTGARQKAVRMTLKVAVRSFLAQNNRE